jgi:hypothetical protein
VCVAPADLAEHGVAILVAGVEIEVSPLLNRGTRKETLGRAIALAVTLRFLLQAMRAAYSACRSWWLSCDCHGWCVGGTPLPAAAHCWP